MGFFDYILKNKNFVENLKRYKLVVHSQTSLQSKHAAMKSSQTRSWFQLVMNTCLRKLIHSIIGLLSILQDENLRRWCECTIDETNHIMTFDGSHGFQGFRKKNVEV